MKKRHLVALHLISVLVIATYVECIQLDNELVSKPQRKCKHKFKNLESFRRRRESEIAKEETEINWPRLMIDSRVLKWVDWFSKGETGSTIFDRSE